MASGPIAYWTYGAGILLMLMNAMNLHLGCSTAMSSWGWGKYTCDDLEEGFMFNQSTYNMAVLLMLMVAATVVDCNVFMAKIIAIAFIFNPILVTVYWSSMKINDHSVPNIIWCIVGLDVGTFAIAAVMGLKGQVAADPKSLTFGALNKWAFGIGGVLFLVNVGNLCQGCNQVGASWGWGQYTCNTLESSLLVTQSFIFMQLIVIVIMAATTTTKKTDLLKICAPMLGALLAQLVYWTQITINGHSLPISIYVVNAIIYGSFFIAAIMHKSVAARQVEPTGYAPLGSA